MMTREQIISEVERAGMIVILRGLQTQQLVRTVDAMAKGGVELVEVTFDQSGRISDEQTAENIKVLRKTFEGRVLVGAGTVMSEAQVELAYAAGAEFIISPDSYEPVIKRTVELGMVSIPGVFTATEAANAHRWGADFLKLFPMSEMKSSYLKALSAPLSHVRFLAVGGVTVDNLEEFFDAGAVGIGISSAIVDKKLIAAEDYDGITELARKYTQAIEACKKDRER